MPTSSPTTPRPKNSSTSTAISAPRPRFPAAMAARSTRPSRFTPSRIPFLRSPTSRACRSLKKMCASSASTPSPSRWASSATRPTRSPQVRALRHLRRLPVPGPCQVRRRHQLHSPDHALPNVTLMTNARVMRLLTNASGTAVTEVEVVHADSSKTAPLCGGLLRAYARAPSTPRWCCCIGQRQAPARAGEQLRPGGAQLHVSPGRRAAGHQRPRRTKTLHQDLGHERLLPARHRPVLSVSARPGAARRQLPLTR